MKHQRRRARALALQALYEVDCVGHPPEAVITRTLEENPGLREDGVDFLRRAVVGTLQAAPTLDGWIAGCAPEWPVDELAVLDRNILRLALWEFRVSGDTPVKVAINEAVELAKRYSSDNASRFVNGVLGTLAEDR
jgi:N utilization substance protein B